VVKISDNSTEDVGGVFSAIKQRRMSGVRRAPPGGAVVLVDEGAG